MKMEMEMEILAMDCFQEEEERCRGAKEEDDDDAEFILPWSS
jgi:hypothetical protein